MSMTWLKYQILCKIYSNHCIISQNFIPNTVISYVSPIYLATVGQKRESFSMSTIFSIKMVDFKILNIVPYKIRTKG